MYLEHGWVDFLPFPSFPQVNEKHNEAQFRGSSLLLGTHGNPEFQRAPRHGDVPRRLPGAPMLSVEAVHRADGTNGVCNNMFSTSVSGSHMV